MRIKSLELQGYKTFAARTLFEFNGEITAIVGPNGSGKSNITDALRWVLGEQSFSLLRAKRTEDLIFSGSEYRPQAGMASATVVLDNEDGWLPIDFTEIAITRRAYRDGQNEYLLNGQRVRLRDISELLARSGLIERTHTIIGQGLVDLALSLNAEERRRLFEEAARISIHKIRKEEALRRLDATHRNIDRVKDILLEIEPRLLNLERQSRRAREYIQIKKNLKTLLMEWYSFQWHQSQVEIAKAQRAMNTQERLLGERRKNVEEIESSIQATRISLQHLREEFISKQKEYFNAKAEYESIKGKVAALEERTRALNQEEALNKERIQFLQDEKLLTAEKISEIEQEIQQLEIERATISSERIRCEKNLKTLQEENFQTLELHHKIQRELATLFERRSNVEQLMNQTTAELFKFTEEVKDLAGAIQSNTQELEKNKDILMTNHRLLTEVTSEREKIESEIAKIQENIMLTEDELASVREEIVRIQSKIEQLKVQLTSLHNDPQGEVEYIDGYRIVENISERDQYHIIGLLRDHIIIPEQLETAIHAVLGEYVEGILLGKDGLDRLIRDLKSKPVHLTLLSKEEIKEGEIIQLNHDKDGVIGVASRLIKCSEQIQTILDYLLGKVVVVQDQQVVHDILSSSSANCVVTLDGEVFIKSGPVLIRRGIPIGRLVNNQYKQKLAKEIEKLEHQLVPYIKKKNTLEERLSLAQSKKEKCAKTLKNLEEREVQLTSTQEGIQKNIEKTEHDIRTLVDKREWLNNQIGILSVQLTDLQSKKELIEHSIEANQTELNSVQSILSRLSLEENREQLVGLEKRLEAITNRAEWLKARQIDLQETYQKIVEELQPRSLRLVEINRAKEAIQKEIEEICLEDSAIKNTLDQLQSMASDAEARLKEIEQNYEDLQKNERIVRQALTTAEHQYAQTRIALSRAQESLESLRRRIEDDLGLVEFEYMDGVFGPTPLPLNGYVEQLPIVSELPPDIEETIRRQKALLRNLGAINLEAETEYQQVKERYDFLTAQLNDLNRAEEDIRQVIAELDSIIEQEFERTFKTVAREFQSYFTRLFGGGSAHLLLTDPTQISTSGVDIEVRLPGRREHSLSLLSGGERSLVAIALIFALIKTSPTPFCVLDEVDAMLDETNTARFRDLLRELSQTTQFIVITHNRNTVEAADVIYGVTMGKDSTSQVISLRLDEVSKVV